MHASCFSYLASVRTLYVEQYPKLNYGAAVIRSESFLAADGPLVAGFLRALGHDALLGANAVAGDDAGRDVMARLGRWGVALAPNSAARKRTPRNVVVSDRGGNRTWFSDLQGIEDALAHVDIGALVEAELVYVDCYEILGAAPRSVIEAVLGTDAKIVLNLGGSPPPSWLRRVMSNRRAMTIQTNADEEDPGDAERTLDALEELNVGDIAVVTAGRHGAIARAGRGRTARAPALAVDVRQVQGAGAAFTASFVHALHGGNALAYSLRYACAGGSLWCQREPDDAPPDAAEIAGHLEPSR